ncbi:hypothetical protein UFOVP1369_20 [uncultured Caudovirales phage]|uniref:Uncharacterized protein n=1 Tax=uncultured Caudovirales phage TaxID=2100421 RepID=A0A6J5S4N1_9CAUD|nr:hypothetical protein UFOVP1369_20 [uncultured Caudovirales phage]
MTIYKGHWEQLPPNPKFPEQEPTEYIRASAGTQEEIRDRLDTWCDDITRKAEELADTIKEQDGCSIAVAREIAWAELDAMLQEQGGDGPIGVDPQVYATRHIIRVCKKELVARQKTGRLKDVKRSLVDRHNWQVCAWACAKFGIESADQITQEHLDWIEDRVVDVQNNPTTAPIRANRVLNSIFGD